jgi:hypothetical protein
VAPWEGRENGRREYNHHDAYDQEVGDRQLDEVPVDVAGVMVEVEDRSHVAGRLWLAKGPGIRVDPYRACGFAALSVGGRCGTLIGIDHFDKQGLGMFRNVVGATDGSAHAAGGEAVAQPRALSGLTVQDAEPVITVGPTLSLHEAAEDMVRHGTHHLVVNDPEQHMPVGILSTLDVAAALAREGR